MTGQTFSSTFSSTNTYNISIASGGAVSLGATGLNLNGATFNLTGDGTGSLSGSGNISVLAGGAANPVSISGVTMSFSYITYGNASAQTPSLYPSFGAGSYTFSDANALRTTVYNYNSGGINVTAGAGAFTLNQTNSTNATNELVDKLSGGFFKIDGNQVSVSGTYTGSDSISLATLNAGLLTKSFNGKAFQVTYTAGTETLTLVAVPEPSVYGLLGAGTLSAAMVRRRRRR